MITCKICGGEQKDRRAKCCLKCLSQKRKAETDRRYIGYKFGLLTVIKRYPSQKTKYVCLCDCGNEVIVPLGHLTSQGKDRTLSCGCHRRKVGKQMAYKNGLGRQGRLEVGSTHGRFTVIGFSHIGPDGASWHLCRCQCGTEKQVRTASLLSGRSKSCGCLHREVSAENLRRARFKHGLSNNKAYLNWRKRARYKDAKPWTYQMEAALRNLQPECVLCGSNENPCVDHVFPFSKGGELVPGNVVILCNTCNISKMDKLLSDLPADKAEKIFNAAYDFAQYWETVRAIMMA